MKTSPWLLIGHDLPYYMTGDGHPNLDYGHPPKGTGRCWRLLTEHENLRIYIRQFWNIETLTVGFNVTCNVDGIGMDNTETKTLRAAKAAGVKFSHDRVMKIFLLECIPDTEPWKPAYDRVHSFVIRAENEMHAREIASRNRGDEGPVAWLNPEFSTCNEILPTGKASVIASDFWQA